MLDILRDADVLDLSGAIGAVRGVLGAPRKIIFEKEKFKGETWQMSNLDFNKRFAAKLGVGPTLMDDLNFLSSCYGNLKSAYAREVAKPMVEFMNKFILEIEREAELNSEEI